MRGQGIFLKRPAVGRDGMPPARWNSDSASATRRYGSLIGTMARAPMVIAVSGPVGAGKTTLVKGIAAGLGIRPDEVQSPSFVLVREYKGPRLWLFHADCYRLGKGKAIELLGLEEYLTPRGILVIEWPRAVRRLTADYLHVKISVTGRRSRLIRLFRHGAARGERGAR